MFLKIYSKLIVLGTFLFSILSADQQLLETKDINRVMQEIFEQHVDKKEMTAAILRHSFQVYIDQFDPNRVYLLESEVQPFLKISDAEMSRIQTQYQKNQFPEYSDLNAIIQKAVLRNRNIRSSLELKDTVQLFHKSSLYVVDGYEEWSDPDLKQPFASGEKDLTKRVEQEIVRFIAGERKRYGDAYVMDRKLPTLRLFERQLREHENQYLFVNDNELPMNEAEKQNSFAIHVLKALSNSLDAHTTVLSPAEAYDMRVRLEKEVQGIGIEVEQDRKGHFIVSHLIEGGPAEKSGQVKLYDHIYQIDNVPLKNKSLSEVLSLIRGKLGTQVSLAMGRFSEENGNPIEHTFNVTLTREEIQVNEDRAQTSFVKYGNGIIGKIKLDSFYQSDTGVTSENDVREAIKKLDQEGHLKGLILDLRENSGGFLSQAVKIVGLFITNGVVVVSKFFNGEEHYYRDMDGKLAYNGPLIILTSKATASAAEIVAQALQDYGVAIIVGDEHTYGKGTIQSQTVTQNQASTYFKVTVGTYYTVSGKTPQIQGVKADIVVPSQFVHENMGEEYLDYPLQQDTITPAYNDSLKDISANLKSWYMRYYVPTIQHRKEEWSQVLPTLKKSSQGRIAINQNYQVFLKSLKPPPSEMQKAEDLQMKEAVNIMQDMINLHSETRGNAPE